MRRSDHGPGVCSLLAGFVFRFGLCLSHGKIPQSSQSSFTASPLPVHDRPTHPAIRTREHERPRRPRSPKSAASAARSPRRRRQGPRCRCVRCAGRRCFAVSTSGCAVECRRQSLQHGEFERRHRAVPRAVERNDHRRRIARRIAPVLGMRGSATLASSLSCCIAAVTVPLGRSHATTPYTPLRGSHPRRGSANGEPPVARRGLGCDGADRFVERDHAERRMVHVARRHPRVGDAERTVARVRLARDRVRRLRPREHAVDVVVVLARVLRGIVEARVGDARRTGSGPGRAPVTAMLGSAPAHDAIHVAVRARSLRDWRIGMSAGRRARRAPLPGRRARGDRAGRILPPSDAVRILRECTADRLAHGSATSAGRSRQSPPAGISASRTHVSHDTRGRRCSGPAAGSPGIGSSPRTSPTPRTRFFGRLVEERADRRGETRDQEPTLPALREPADLARSRASPRGARSPLPRRILRSSRSMSAARRLIPGTFSYSTMRGGVAHVASIVRVQSSASWFRSWYFCSAAFASDTSPELPLHGAEPNATSGAVGPANARNCSGVIFEMSAHRAGDFVSRSKSRHASGSMSMPPTERKRTSVPRILALARMNPSAPAPRPQNENRAVYSRFIPPSLPDRSRRPALSRDSRLMRHARSRASPRAPRTRCPA
jgi:hypothetical protein